MSLRSLSMVLRQLPPEVGAQEQGKCIIESVDLARQAVQLDVTDGTSWCKFVSVCWCFILKVYLILAFLYTCLRLLHNIVYVMSFIFKPLPLDVDAMMSDKVV